MGQALKRLGVEHIGAYSPQARGRSERAFQTLQDRLPKELRLAGISSIGAANAFIRDAYLPAHNAGFTVALRTTRLGLHPDLPARLHSRTGGRSAMTIACRIAR